MYDRQQWRDDDTATPITADRLEHLESGIATADRRIGLRGGTRVAPASTVDVPALVGTIVDEIMQASEYSDPSGDTVKGILSQLSDAAAGDAPAVVDEQTGRVVSVVQAPGTGLGVVVVPHGRPVDILISAPHPIYDAGTPEIAVTLWDAAGEGAALIVAGNRRGDATGTNPADAARNAKHPVSRVCAHYAARGVPIFEQHGFADSSAPGVSAFVSGGATGEQPHHVRLRRILTDMGWTAPAMNEEPKNVLRGTTNPHGVAARDMGTMFTHVELSASKRGGGLEDYIRAVADCGLLDGRQVPAGAAYPAPIGSVNVNGTAPGYARADHTHRLTQNDPEDGQFVVRKNGGWRSVGPDEARVMLGVTPPA